MEWFPELKRKKPRQAEARRGARSFFWVGCRSNGKVAVKFRAFLRIVTRLFGGGGRQLARSLRRFDRNRTPHESQTSGPAVKAGPFSSSAVRQDRGGAASQC